MAERPEEAESVLLALGAHGIDMAAVGDELVEDGLGIFARDLDQILDAIRARRGYEAVPSLAVPAR